MSKILIFGYPHCGTSILKSVISHIPNVEEIVEETHVINKNTDKDFIICKYPFACKEFFTNKYQNYIKIFIIRNPLFVFSSINKRFKNYNVIKFHDKETYVETIKKYLYHKNNDDVKNMHFIRYEDMFDNDFKNLKKLFDKIGLKYDDDIFNNEKYDNKLFNNFIDKPDLKHAEYRTKQINQKFENMNHVEKLYLTKEQINYFVENEFVKRCGYNFDKLKKKMFDYSIFNINTKNDIFN